MLTPAGLADTKKYADGIGPWKPMIVPLKITPYMDTNPDGTPYSGATNFSTTQAPTTVIADAHSAGLFVHIFTFRNESKYLANDYEGDPEAEYLKFFAWAPTACSPISRARPCRRGPRTPRSSTGPLRDAASTSAGGRAATWWPA